MSCTRVLNQKYMPLVYNINLFVIVFVLSVSLNFILKKFAYQFKIVDIPDGDELKIHSSAVPMTGGPAIFLSFALALFFIPAIEKRFLLLTLSLAIVLTGFIDDFKGLKPSVRFIIHILCGLFIFILFNPEFFGSIIISALFVSLMVASSINAFNMVDGMDGLCAGTALISCLGFAFAGRHLNDPSLFWTSLILIFLLLGFLPFNFNRAKVFLGDSGSGWIGFICGYMAIRVVSSFPGKLLGVIAATLLLGAPVIDMFAAISRRLSKGQPPFMGDRSHFYDVLHRTFSVKKTVIISYIIQLLLVSAGVILLY